MPNKFTNSLTNDNLKNLSGYKVIDNILKKGKCLPIHIHDVLNNSNHSNRSNRSNGVSDVLNHSNGENDVLNNSNHSTCNSACMDRNNEFSNSSSHSDDGFNSRQVILPRFADIDKVSAKQRFTTETSDNFITHKRKPNGYKSTH